MGTDIHPIVQVRTGDEWRTVKLPRDVLVALNIRNYNAFAILGNVRNGYGFAGSDTGEEFPYISHNRGLPDDYRATEHDEDDCPHEYCGSWCDHGEDFGDHSVSWVSLRELLDYPWAAQTVHRGWIPSGKYEYWLAYGKPEGMSPESYCSSASGGGVASVSEDEYRSLKENDSILYLARANRPWVNPPKVHSLYVRSSWYQRNSVAADRLYNVVLPYLQTIGAPEDVRIVFGFDS